LAASDFRRRATFDFHTLYFALNIWSTGMSPATVLQRLSFGLLLLTSLFFTSQVLAQGKFVEGTHFQRLKTPQPVSTGSNIEVLEIFSYACSHCAHFEPTMQKWKASKPKNAQLVLLPAIFNQSWVPFARAFYVAQSLNILDKSHLKLFNALHTEGKQFANVDELASWYAAAGTGITAKQFTDAFVSSGLEAKLQESVERVPKYEVDGTPSVVVDGKFKFDVTSAGGLEAVPDLINHLVAQAARERAGKPK
jgi:protein dithiol oxidoreductase (disulfide-forming)